MLLRRLLAIWLVIAATITPAMADSITIPYSFSDGQVIQAAQFNSNNTAITTAVNGNLDNNNLKSGAAIALSKLAATTEFFVLRSSGNKCISAGVTGDSVARACFTSDGYLQMGPGSASATDIELRRITGPILRVNDVGATANLPFQALSFQASVLGDANAKVQADTSNGLTMGAGGASARDMSLRRKSSTYFQVTDLAGTTNTNVEASKYDATTNGDTQPKVSLSTSGIDFGVGGSTAPALRLKYEDANTISIRNGTTDNAYKNLKALNGNFTGTLDASGTTTLGTMSAGSTTLGATTATSLTVNSITVGNVDHIAGLNGGRLTIVSGAPNGQASAQGTLYWTPDVHGYIGLWDGSVHQIVCPGEKSLSLTVSSGSQYDVWGTYSGGTLALSLSGAWSSASSRGFTVNADSYGVLSLSTDRTKRYLGTIYASGSNQVTHNSTIGGVYNQYNQRLWTGTIAPSDATHTYTTATWREWNSGSTNGVSRVTFICGQPSDVTAMGIGKAVNSGSALVDCAFGYDSSSSPSGSFALTPGWSSGLGLPIFFNTHAAAGLHSVRLLEKSTASGTTTWYGVTSGDDQTGGTVCQNM